MFRTCLLLLSSLVLVQCNSSKKSASASLKQVPSFLLGDFKDDYDIRYTISETKWVQHPNAIYHLVSYDSAGKFFVARNDSKNPSDADLYTRIDIMEFKNMEPWQWGFCLTKYNAKSAGEARMTAAADRVNPKKGCNDYPFSRMKRIE